MSTTFDALIIGAGLNGLTTAAYLARAGQRVLVLERRAVIGGAAATEEFRDAPGFRFDTVTHNVAGFDPRIADELGLAQYGLQLIDADPTLYAPLPDGAGLTIWRDDAKTIASLERLSANDAARWSAFRQRIARLASFADALHTVTPPSIASNAPEDLWTLGSLGLKLRGLGKREMIEFLRTLPMPVYDLLTDEFENELLKGALGAGGIRGVMLGPRGGGTAYNFLRQCSGGVLRATTLVRGGIGKLADALAAAAKARGAELRTDAAVVDILVREQRAWGVVLASGEEIRAARIVSSADPRRTFLCSIDPIQLDPSFLARVRHIRLRGAVAKINLALDALPAFKGATAEQLRGTISISPSLDYLERAYDDAKYGQISRHPYLELVIPSLVDPTRAPEGKHVMSVWVQYVPYKLATGDQRLEIRDGRLETGDWRLETGDWSQAKEKLGHWVIRELEEYAPNLQSLISNLQVLTPCDLEHTYGLTEGDLNQGQIALDQFLFMRSVPGWAQYRTPIEGLWLCGAGAHPGGIPCAAGRIAAREILKRR